MTAPEQDGASAAAADVVFASTAYLAAAIRSRKLSAVEALEAHLAQIERHNGALNAVVIMDAEAARKRAEAADAALARGEILGPLHGVPHTLKDAHATAGMPSTVGFPPFARHVAKEDGTVAARLKAAGAILVGKTNAAMLLGDYQSSNPLFGRTSNPWNTERTPGGSSGGAAAALAAGMTPFEIGTDMAASIRVPAHFCGVFGLKPTESRVSLHGGFPDPQGLPRSVRLMSCIGPMARTVDDLALLYGIIAGPDGHDTEVKPVPVEPMREVELRGLRVAYAPTFAGIAVAGDIRKTAEELSRRLEGEGAIVEEARLPDIDIGGDLESAGELIGMMLGAAQEDGPPAPLKRYFEALHRRDQSILAWERFFESWDVLLCPAAMVTAFAHCEPGTPLDVDGKPADYWTVSAHGTLFNYTGHPAIVLPCGSDRGGLPIGLQLVGRLWDEARLLGIAKAVSQLTGGFRAPPGY
ncbi:amidase [Mesorhizobium albiziae]|nr:amidase [Mesorhizobium albiziae]